MHRVVLLSLLVALATACPADPEPGESTTTGPTSLTETGLDGCGTGGDCCAVNPNFCPPTDSTGPDPAESTSLGTSEGPTGTASTEGSTESTAGDTEGSVTPCGFEDTLCMLATGKTEPVDCGIVTLDDDAAAWQAASDCAVSNAGMQSAFKVAFQQPSDDSLVFDGYFGTVGIVYGVGRLYTDTFGDPMLGIYQCTDVVAMAGCMVDVAEHCLQCEGEGAVTPLECVR